MTVLADATTDAGLRRVRRAALAQHPTQIGIDFVTVDPARQSLTLHFVPGAPGTSKSNTLERITRSHLVVTGGEGTRPANLRIARVQANVRANSLLLSYALDSDPQRASDFPDYLLRLVDLPAVDPFFASIPFTLRLDDTAVFDPVSAALAPASTPAEIDIDYLARDYASLRRLMLDRLSLQMPRWTDQHPADMGVAIVEVLAYAADQLSYYQDAVATEAYLGTARRRTSVRRHARLLDYRMHDGCNARAWVQMLVDGAAVPVPRGTVLLTRSGPEPRITPDSTALQQAVANGAQFFETLHDAVVSDTLAELRVHTWGAPEYVLPAGSVSATLRDALVDPANPAGGRALDRLAVGQVLIVEEVRSPLTGEARDADLGRRHAVRLRRVMRGIDRLGDPGVSNGTAIRTDASGEVPVVEIEWDRADALPFAVVVAAVQGDRAIPSVSVFRGNIVLADHGRTLDEEALPDVPPQGRYRPSLSRGRITCGVPFDVELASTQPAAAALAQDPRAAVAHVTVTESTPGSPAASVRWAPVRDLLRSDRFAREFVAEIEADGRATLRFGDNARGQRPGARRAFTARYRIGTGVDGNVGCETIAHVVSDDVRLVGVRNPLPAQGGVEPEPIEQVRLLAPWAFKTQERCVTVADYRAIAERHPEVRQAAAVTQWTGSWYTASVSALRHGGRPVDTAFTSVLQTFLGPYVPAGVDLEVRAPRYVACDIGLVVHIAPDRFRSSVRQALREVFSSSTLPDGRLGFFHPERFGFGQSIFSSQIVAAAMRIAGVLRVDVDRFQRWGRPARGEREAGRIAVGALDVARVDSDPNAPENGMIAFRVEGGL